MFDQFTIVKLKEHFRTIILKFQIYCVSHDTHKAGFKSLTPLIDIDDQGYEDQLNRNKDLREEIHRCQIQLQELLELVETDNDSLLARLGHVKPPSKPALPPISNQSEEDSDTAIV